MNALAGEDPFDYEKRFYEIMAGVDADALTGMVSRLKTDLVDVSKGTQCGVNSEGLPYFTVLLQGEKSVMYFLHAWDNIVDHACPDAVLTMMWLWAPVVGAVRKQLLGQISEAARTMPDPFHGGDSE